jgi:predicted PurR-regulated permease PerM
MLGIEPRAVRFTWSVLLTAGAVAFLYVARRTILIFLLAIFFAYLLSPIVTLVDQFFPRRVSRTVALAAVYLALIGLLIGGITTIGTKATAEAASLVQRVPDLNTAADRLTNIPMPDWLEFLRAKLLSVIREQLDLALGKAVPMLRTAIGQLLLALGNVGFALLVPILGFFFLKDGNDVKNAALDMAGNDEKREFLDGLLLDIHTMLGHYIRALFLLSVAVFLLYAGFFTVAGVPYASLLATIAALLEFIPVLGPLLGAVIACVVAAISGYDHVGWMVIFFLVYRGFQDYVLSPHLMGAGLALHPLLVIFGALAGEEVAGIPGMLFSAPVLATFRLMYVRARRRQVAT